MAQRAPEVCKGPTVVQDPMERRVWQARTGRRVLLGQPDPQDRVDQRALAALLDPRDPTEYLARPDPRVCVVSQASRVSEVSKVQLVQRDLMVQLVPRVNPEFRVTEVRPDREVKPVLMALLALRDPQGLVVPRGQPENAV